VKRLTILLAPLTCRHSFVLGCVCVVVFVMGFAPQFVAAEGADTSIKNTGSVSGSDQWTQWRGPNRDGQWSGAVWPDRVDEQSLVLKWRVPMGPSYSGPIVTADLVFTTETRDQSTEVVTALDRKSGEVRWSTSWEGAIKVPFFARANGDWIRATPAWDGEHLYVAGMKDVLVCLAGDSGEVIWRRDFPKEQNSGVPEFGFVSSPLVERSMDAVFVQAGGCVQRLDRRTGVTVWKALEDGSGMKESPFSSPILAEIAGRQQLVVQTRTTLAGLDPADGKVLWEQEIKASRAMNILTPTVVGDRVFTSAYGGGTQTFDVVATGTKFGLKPAWQYKAEGYMTSPVVVNGKVYLHLRNQRALCLDWETGQEQWTSGESFGKYWSLVTQDDRILALDDRGLLFLLKANPDKLEILDQRKVGTDTWAHLAIVDHGMFIRELDALAAYEWR